MIENRCEFQVGCCWFEPQLHILNPLHTGGCLTLGTNVFELADVIKAHCHHVCCHNHSKEMLSDPLKGAPLKPLLENINNGESKWLPEEHHNEESMPSLKVETWASRDGWGEESVPSIHQSLNCCDGVAMLIFTAVPIATGSSSLHFGLAL
jgi:hypothetical protein